MVQNERNVIFNIQNRPEFSSAPASHNSASERHQLFLDNDAISYSRKITSSVTAGK